MTTELKEKINRRSLFTRNSGFFLSHRPFPRSGHDPVVLEHCAQKWVPVLRKKQCDHSKTLEHCAQKWIPVLRKNNATTQDRKAFFAFQIKGTML
jgi:hypothetical protein